MRIKETSSNSGTIYEVAAQAVSKDAVKAYRNYYHTAKPFAKWEWKRPAPEWWQGYQGVA